MGLIGHEKHARAGRKKIYPQAAAVRILTFSAGKP